MVLMPGLTVAAVVLLLSPASMAQDCGKDADYCLPAQDVTSLLQVQEKVKFAAQRMQKAIIMEQDSAEGEQIEAKASALVALLPPGGPEKPPMEPEKSGPKACPWNDMKDKLLNKDKAKRQDAAKEFFGKVEFPKGTAVFYSGFPAAKWVGPIPDGGNKNQAELADEIASAVGTLPFGRTLPGDKMNGWGETSNAAKEKWDFKGQIKTPKSLWKNAPKWMQGVWDNRHGKCNMKQFSEASQALAQYVADSQVPTIFVLLVANETTSIPKADSVWCTHELTTLASEAPDAEVWVIRTKPQYEALIGDLKVAPALNAELKKKFQEESAGIIVKAAKAVPDGVMCKK